MNGYEPPIVAAIEEKRFAIDPLVFVAAGHWRLGLTEVRLVRTFLIGDIKSEVLKCDKRITVADGLRFLVRDENAAPEEITPIASVYGDGYEIRNEGKTRTTGDQKPITSVLHDVNETHPSPGGLVKLHERLPPGYP